MNDLRTQLPECPLEYQVPHIPGSHTALVIEIHATEIDSQEKMIPWTLAGLINNTDIVMKGVHLYVVCEDGETQDRIKTALKKFDLPPGTITEKDKDSKPLITFGKYGYRYDSYCMPRHQLLGVPWYRQTGRSYHHTPDRSRPPT